MTKIIKKPYIINVNIGLIGEWWIATSDQVLGLFVSNQNLEKVITDIPLSIKTMMNLNHDDKFNHFCKYKNIIVTASIGNININVKNTLSKMVSAIDLVSGLFHDDEKIMIWFTIPNRVDYIVLQ